jgi:2-polyprenyl-3-methyl-5-hydroxy-6-metoxy-1,4-benzoquinol methylase
VARRRLPSDAKILDVGSAIGHTLKRMKDVGFANVFGVEMSEEMISKSFPDATIIRSSKFPSEYAPFDMVTANWTLHFILEGRDQYLRDIYAGLKP